MSLNNRIYYQLKPYIPRSLQIALRRMVIRRKRKLYEHIWPIDERAAKPPEGWTGWPDGKKFALVLTHDVETEKGLKNCIPLAKLEENLGFRSSFNFVAEDYEVPEEIFDYLTDHGFEIGVHGLHHDGNLFESKEKFQKQATRINRYLKDWGAKGFRTPIMYHNLEWIHDLNIEYDSSTFDTDPFEPQADGMETIFPFWVKNGLVGKGYVELPYTLPQDHTLFILMNEKSIDIWKRKLDWIARKEGMALIITHPDYMNFKGLRSPMGEYPANHYREFLGYIKKQYEGEYWQPLSKDLADFCQKKIRTGKKSIPSQQVTQIDPTKDRRWNQFVEEHPYGWVCHLPEWKIILENCFKHMKGHYFVLTKNNSIRAALPVFEVKSWLTGKRLVSIPFATLCDPLISDNDELKLLFEEILGLMKEVGASHIELRSRAASSLLQEDHFYVQRFYRHHYLILDKDPEHLKKNFHRTCVRQRINRARCSNLVLKVGDCKSDLQLFYHLYVLTRKRLGLPPLPYLFFKSIWEAFSPYHKIMLLLAKCDDQLAAGLILFKFRDRVSAEFAASDTTYNDFSPNHLLFWEGIKSAYSEGYKIFDFGRTSPNNKTLMEFKNHWGTQVVDLPIFYYPKETVDRLGIREELRSYKMINKVCHWAPESAMGFIGSFCYKHLG